MSLQTEKKETLNPKKQLSALIQEGQRQSSLHFEPIPVKGYEQVIKVTDKRSQLTAIIAIHNTSLGPALGGIRIRPYSHFNDALEDVLRLAKGMTYKSAIADVGYGGGKSVIIADPATQKTPEMLLSMGNAIEQLGGSYIGAEDMGSTTADCQIIRRATKYVVGLPQAKSSGDPSPFTAYGIFRGVQSVFSKTFWHRFARWKNGGHSRTRKRGVEIA